MTARSLGEVVGWTRLRSAALISQDISRRWRGFTLTELLVVIAVIALIAALLLPVLADARERGRRTACLSNLRQIGAAHQLYLDDWDGRFPNWEVKILPDEWGLWMRILQPYLHSTAVLRCPSSATRWQVGVSAADYALCTWGPGGKGTREEPYHRWPGPPLSPSEVKRPGETIAVADGWTAPDWTIVDGWSLAAAMPGHRLRHGRGLNAAFVDGHARWLSAEELWRLDTDGHGFYWWHYATADR